MNWGYRLLLTFIIFSLGMGIMVYLSISTHYELVDKDYYSQELNYQDIIERKKEANLSSNKLMITLSNNLLTIALDNPKSTHEVEGTIYFYCPANSKYDKTFPLQLDKQGKQLIEAFRFEKGNYMAKFTWSVNNKHYYLEKEIYIP